MTEVAEGVKPAKKEKVEVEEVKPLQFTVAQLLPWVIVLVLAVAFLTYIIAGRGGSGPSPTPAPVPVDNSRVEQLDKILDYESGQYLSAVANKVALFIEKDQTILTTRKDITQVSAVMGQIVTLDHGKYDGLGAVLATYFDEESEFPQTVAPLSPQDRVMAAQAWKKVAVDLAEVE